MKKILTLLAIYVVTATANAQIVQGLDIKNVAPEKRKELINSLTSEQKREIVKTYRENILIDDLKIQGEDKQEEFKKIYHNYQTEQRKIKDGFNPNFDMDKLSNEEAATKLEQSFVTGEKLMNLRRKFAVEFQKVLTPQQILKMFQNEGAMRDKIIGKWQELRGDNKRGEQGRGKNQPSSGR